MRRSRREMLQRMLGEWRRRRTLNHGPKPVLGDNLVTPGVEQVVERVGDQALPNLSLFVGRTMDHIGLGEFQIQFHFHSGGCIDLWVEEARWELLDASGAVLDRDQVHKERATYQLHRLLGQELQAWTVDPQRSFSLTFGNGLVLRVYAVDGEYRSFEILWPPRPPSRRRSRPRQL